MSYFTPYRCLLANSSLNDDEFDIPKMEKTGLEPTTPTLRTWCSTTELLPLIYRSWYIIPFYFISKEIRYYKNLIFLNGEDWMRTSDPRVTNTVLYN